MTKRERLVSEAGNAVGDREIGHAATLKGCITDGGDAGGDREAVQAGTFSESIVCNAGYAVSNREAG